jgi:GTP:adenosylcobinamide-phosphate guanylyltransferase
MTTDQTIRFTAIILAGNRPGQDPVAEAAGVACKALAPIGGRPMLYRVLDALAAAQQVGPRLLCGPSQQLIEHIPEIKKLIDTGEVQYIASYATPSASTYHALQSIPDSTPILLTTADHALLTAQIVDFFCSEVRQLGCDVAAGLTPYDVVISAFPESRRTAIKFNDCAYSGCNLFGFLNPRSYRAAQFWQRMEQERKKPLRMIRILGWRILLRYLLGRLSLDDGIAHLSKLMGIRAGAVILPFPEAAVDVDTVDDWHFVQNLVKKQGY